MRRVVLLQLRDLPAASALAWSLVRGRQDLALAWSIVRGPLFLQVMEARPTAAAAAVGKSVAARGRAAVRAVVGAVVCLTRDICHFMSHRVIPGALVMLCVAQAQGWMQTVTELSTSFRYRMTLRCLMHECPLPATNHSELR